MDTDVILKIKIDRKKKSLNWVFRASLKYSQQINTCALILFVILQ